MTGVTSEVGRLRSVLLHRPGPELSRLTPSTSADLLFDGIPWVERAQEEHDAFSAALTSRGVEVVLLDRLLLDVLEIEAARRELIAAAIQPWELGPTLAAALVRHLRGLDPAGLLRVLVAGLTHEEIPAAESLVSRMSRAHAFVVSPLPNLLFTRDSSVWIGGSPLVTKPSMPARRRESSLTAAVYGHHPRFAGLIRVDGGTSASGLVADLEGGDVLLLAEGVVAVGVGQRTTPAGVELLAERLFATGAARSVLAVPISQERATMHLDTVCTMVDVDAVVMYPAVADTLRAFTLTPGAPVVGPRPFLEAAAEAMGIAQLRVIDTGLDPVTAEREQWDDGNNTLALAPKLCVAYERNVNTNGRLEAEGIEVVLIAGSELGSGRGGPRCMSCPLERDPL